MHCAVSSCKNSLQRKDKKITFHRFPQDLALRNKWLEILQIPSDSQDLQVCSDHFEKSSWYMVGMLRKLRKDALPNLHKAPSVNKPSMPKQKPAEWAPEPMNETDKVLQIKKDLGNLQFEMFSFRQEFKREARSVREGISKIRETCNCEKSLEDTRMLSLVPCLTGLSTKTFTRLIKLVHSSGNLKELPTYKIKSKNQVAVPIQFLISYLRLKHAINYKLLAQKFALRPSTVYQICSFWTQLMYQKLGAIFTFPHRNALSKYENVVGIADIVEFNVETPSCSERQKQYVNKHQQAKLKSLIIVDINGNIIFVSKLIPGSVSNKQVLKESGLVSLLKKRVGSNELLASDVIMADEGFGFENLPPNIKILTKKQLGEDKEMLKMKQNVERAVRKIKEFVILKNKIQITQIRSINKIHMVCWAISNFLNLVSRGYDFNYD